MFHEEVFYYLRPFFYFSGRFNKIVIARSGATCLHAEVLTSGVTARRRGNLMRLLHGVYPEQNNEILPLRLTQGQNDKNRRVRNDTTQMLTYLWRSL